MSIHGKNVALRKRQNWWMWRNNGVGYLGILPRVLGRVPVHRRRSANVPRSVFTYLQRFFVPLSKSLVLFYEIKVWSLAFWVASKRKKWYEKGVPRCLKVRSSNIRVRVYCSCWGWRRGWRCRGRRNLYLIHMSVQYIGYLIPSEDKVQRQVDN